MLLGIFLIMSLFLVMPQRTQAQTLQDMYDQLAELQDRYNKNKNNKELTESQIKQLNNEISSISATIEKTR